MLFYILKKVISCSQFLDLKTGAPGFEKDALVIASHISESDHENGLALYNSVPNPASNFTRHKSSVEARFGDSDGLKIKHTGLQGQIECTIGMLSVKTASQLLVSSSTGENMIKAVNNGAVDLYYDNVRTFSTGSTGITVQGNSNDITFVNDSATDHNYLKVFVSRVL